MERDVLTFTVEQAAEQLQLSLSTAYRLIRRGELPAVRIGQQLRIPRMALEERLRVSAK